MRNKGISIKKPSSIGGLSADRDYEYLKAKNNELSKEVAEHRKNRSKMQADIDYILREKFEAELKYNKVYQLVSDIDRRSKLCLNKIVESSTELTQIMQLTNRIKNLDTSKSSDIRLTPQTKRSPSFKQVVTPHAVNGHIIHSPTIRLSRYNEPCSEFVENCSSGRRSEQNPCLENMENNGEVEANEEEENEDEVEGNEDEESNAEDPEEETLENNKDSEDSEEESDEENRVLPTIDEENEPLGDFNMDEMEEQPVFSGRFQEVKIYLNQLPDNVTLINARREYRKSLTDVPEAERSNSSVTVETSTSFDGTERFNEDSLLLQSEDVSVQNKFDSSSSGRNSFVQRKSIGSPVPSKIARRNTYKKRNSSPIPSTSGTSCSSTSTSMNSSHSSDSVQSDISTLEKTIINLKSLDGPLDSTEDSNVTGNLEVSRAGTVSSMGSFIENTSVHSTPLVIQNQTIDNSCINIQTPVKSYINTSTRRNRSRKSPLDPYVRLTRIKVSPEKQANSTVDLMNSSQIFRESSEEEEELLTKNKVKKTGSRKRKTKKEIDPPYPGEVLTKRKPENCTNETNSGSRPKRSRKVVSLKEPSLTKKMRRSR